MAIHDEVAVGSLLILADAGLKERRVFQSREAEAEIFADVSQRFLVDHALTTRRIEGGTAGIVGDLESPPIAAWDAIHKRFAMVAPDRQVGISEIRAVARRHAKEENILFGRTNQVTNNLEEQFPQPRPASKDVDVRCEPRPIRQD